MILKVARIGHPVVRAAARDVTRDEMRGPGLQRLVEDMLALTRSSFSRNTIAWPRRRCTCGCAWP